MSRRVGSNEGKFDATSILELLRPEPEREDYWRTRRQIERRAPTPELIAALEQTDDTVLRRVLCHIIGRRCAPEAVPVLISCLNDPDGYVCTEAAEALGNIGNASAGPALLERPIRPGGGCSQNLLIYALSAVGYTPAIPHLIEALEDPALRGSAAVALGSLGAVDALDPLRRALEQEIESESSRKLLQRGLRAVEMVAQALSSKDIGPVLPSLLKALNSPDPVLAEAATRALCGVEDARVGPALQAALASQKDECGVSQRMREALTLIEQRGNGVV